MLLYLQASTMEPLTWEQHALLCLLQVIPNKDMAKTIVRLASPKLKHLAWTKMVKVVLSRPGMAACDLCYQPCSLNRHGKRTRRRNPVRLARRWDCRVKRLIIETDDLMLRMHGGNREEGRWVERICDICIGNLVDRVTPYGMSHPFYRGGFITMHIDD